MERLAHTFEQKGLLKSKVKTCHNLILGLINNSIVKHAKMLKGNMRLNKSK
jgi:hypothetical protein